MFRRGPGLGALRLVRNSDTHPMWKKRKGTGKKEKKKRKKKKKKKEWLHYSHRVSLSFSTFGPGLAATGSPRGIGENGNGNGQLHRHGPQPRCSLAFPPAATLQELLSLRGVGFLPGVQSLLALKGRPGGWGYQPAQTHNVSRTRLVANVGSRTLARKTSMILYVRRGKQSQVGISCILAAKQQMSISSVRAGEEKNSNRGAREPSDAVSIPIVYALPYNGVCAMSVGVPILYVQPLRHAIKTSERAHSASIHQ